ncbi:MAG: IS21 family transposase, partial [Candidatus Dormibacteraceae bacterium]
KGVYLGGQRVRAHIFTMILGYSRRIFARAYVSEGLDSLLDGHQRAFAHFGGRTEEILYDNPRTIVTDKDEVKGTVVWNGTFKDRMDFYGVAVRLCRYYRAQTKGKVESGVKYVKANALAGRQFRDLEDLNAYLIEWCLAVADQRIHGTTHEKPSARFARGEMLIPVDLRPAPPRQRVVVRRVPRDAYVAVETNRYPVCFGWVGKDVEVSVTIEQVRIVCQGAEPVFYRRLSGSHQVAHWEGPVRSLPQPEEGAMAAPPRFDLAYLASIGEVQIRELAGYERIASGVQS